MFTRSTNWRRLGLRVGKLPAGSQERSGRFPGEKSSVFSKTPSVAETIELDRALKRRVLGNENAVAVVGVAVVEFGEGWNSLCDRLRIGEGTGPIRGLLLLLDGLGRVSVLELVANVTVDDCVNGSDVVALLTVRETWRLN